MWLFDIEVILWPFFSKEKTNRREEEVINEISFKCSSEVIRGKRKFTKQNYNKHKVLHLKIKLNRNVLHTIYTRWEKKMNFRKFNNCFMVNCMQLCEMHRTFIVCACLCRTKCNVCVFSCCFFGFVPKFLFSCYLLNWNNQIRKFLGLSQVCIAWISTVWVLF